MRDNLLFLLRRMIPETSSSAANSTARAAPLPQRRLSLHQKLLARNREQALLLGISQAIATVRDPQQLLAVVTAQVGPAFGGWPAGLFVLSPDGTTHRNLLLELADDPAALELRAGFGSRFPQAGSAIDFFIQQAQPGLYDLRQVQAAGFDHPHFPVLFQRGLVHALAAPLQVSGRVLGVFTLVASDPAAFRAELLPLFAAVTDLMALATANITATDELLARKREQALQLAVTQAVQTGDTWPERFLAVARVLQTFLPFTFIGLGVNLSAEVRRVNCFRRVGTDEYQAVDLSALARMNGHTPDQTLALLRPLIQATNTARPSLHTGADFPAHCRQHPFKAMLARTFKLAANVEAPVPLSTGGHLVVSLYSDRPDAYVPADQDLLACLAGPFTDTVEKLLAFEQVQQLKEQLEAEKQYLETELKGAYNFEEIIGTGPAVQRVLAQVRQVAPTDATVLLLGETGTGKELFARALHDASPRRGKVLVKLNCAALPAQLIESELFGHEKGAFTGAIGRRIGKFELAQGSTLFLDEIGELPLELQSRLLRVLQEKELERLGGNQVIKVDVRIVAATNRGLAEEVAAGRFRADLYYRLNVFPIQLPALRERPEDLPLLAQHFLRKFAQRFGRPARQLAPEVLPALLAHTWPGNVRELEHVFEQAMVLNTTPELTLAQPLGPVRPPAAAAPVLAQPWQEAERANILAALRATGGRVHGPAGAAALLHIHPNTLDSRMRKLGLQKTFGPVPAAGEATR